MKVLIWIVCAFCFGTITTIFKYNGVIIGGIPTAFLFLITVGLAPLLCKKWDNHKQGKEDQKYFEEQQTGLKAEERIATSGTDSSILQRNIAPLGLSPKKEAAPAPEKTKKHKKDKPPKEPKIRYCKLCGGLIDSDTKKCSSCGKQYFKIKITKNIIVVSALSFVIAALGGLNIWQCVDRINAQDEIESLNQTVSSKQQSISNLVEENNTLQGKIQALEGGKKGIASDFLNDIVAGRRKIVEEYYEPTKIT